MLQEYSWSAKKAVISSRSAVLDVQCENDAPPMEECNIFTAHKALQ